MTRPLRVLLADDDTILLRGLVDILNSQPGIEVVAAVNDGAAAMRAMTSYSIDVALLDVDMPLVDGIQAAAHISRRYPKTTVVMLTAFEHDNFLDRALAAGAHGFLTKDIPADQLAHLIYQACSGNMVMGFKPTQILASSYLAQLHRRDEHHEFIAAVEALPPHLRAVFDLMAHAMPNKTIAARLHLAENTVRVYVSQILKATNSPSRAHLALTATKSGLVT